eukprot:1150807-Pelagomonas_calceolata.AAC.4
MLPHGSGLTLATVYSVQCTVEGCFHTVLGSPWLQYTMYSVQLKDASTRFWAHLGYLCRCRHRHYGQLLTAVRMMLPGGIVTRAPSLVPVLEHGDVLVCAICALELKHLGVESGALIVMQRIHLPL